MGWLLSNDRKLSGRLILSGRICAAPRIVDWLRSIGRLYVLWQLRLRHDHDRLLRLYR